jgi:hypothetical protein
MVTNYTGTHMSETALRVGEIKVHIENRRLFNMAVGRLKLEEWEQSHLHGCEVCQGVLYVLVHQPFGAVPQTL